MCKHALVTDTCPECDGAHAHDWTFYDSNTCKWRCEHCTAVRCTLMHRESDGANWVPCALRYGHPEPHDFAGVWVNK